MSELRYDHVDDNSGDIIVIVDGKPKRLTPTQDLERGVLAARYRQSGERISSYPPSPRVLPLSQIQSLVREGYSYEQIAQLYKIDEDVVHRFALPIEEEKKCAISQFLSCSYITTSGRKRIGDLLKENLSDIDFSPSSSLWLATRVRHEPWHLTLYVSKVLKSSAANTGRNSSLEYLPIQKDPIWWWNMRNNSITCINAEAANLLKDNVVMPSMPAKPSRTSGEKTVHNYQAAQVPNISSLQALPKISKDTKNSSSFTGTHIPQVSRSNSYTSDSSKKMNVPPITQSPIFHPSGSGPISSTLIPRTLPPVPHLTESPTMSSSIMSSPTISSSSQVNTRTGTTLPSQSPHISSRTVSSSSLPSTDSVTIPSTAPSHTEEDTLSTLSKSRVQQENISSIPFDFSANIRLAEKYISPSEPPVKEEHSAGNSDNTRSSISSAQVGDTSPMGSRVQNHDLEGINNSNSSNTATTSDDKNNTRSEDISKKQSSKSRRRFPIPSWDDIIFGNPQNKSS